jgi:hypothetical protein
VLYIQDPAILDVIKESFSRESHYEHRRRMKQIETIRNFATTLEHFYDRLERWPSSENKSK